MSIVLRSNLFGLIGNIQLRCVRHHRVIPMPDPMPYTSAIWKKRFPYRSRTQFEVTHDEVFTKDMQLKTLEERRHGKEKNNMWIEGHVSACLQSSILNHCVSRKWISVSVLRKVQFRHRSIACDSSIMQPNETEQTWRSYITTERVSSTETCSMDRPFVCGFKCGFHWTKFVKTGYRVDATRIVFAW